MPIEDRIKTLWGEISAAMHEFLTLIAEFDRSNAWMGTGMTSCAQWLNLHCGINDVVAREKLRVAHAIAGLPLINEALRTGRVSYSKVRAMTRVATPENEAILLNIAVHGTAAHVERTVRQFRRVERLEQAALAAESHRRRNVLFRTDDDDSLLISARFPAEVGELVRLAIERAAELVEPVAQNAPDEPDYTYDRIGRRRAEGLRILAEQFLANGANAEKDAKDTASSADRYQVVVHIDQAALSDSGSDSGRRSSSDNGNGNGNDSGNHDQNDNLGNRHRHGALCELEDGPALAAETARRLACDGSLVGILEADDRHPLNVGRKTRAIPAAIRRALKARDGGCRFPGCTHTRFTEGHHIKHWADGGETRLDNLVTLCRFHHHLIHEGGFDVARLDDGAFHFTRPDGTPLADPIPADQCFSGNNLPERLRDRGIGITPRTIDTKWIGETMDYSIAIDALLAAREKSEGRSPAHSK